MLTTVLSLAEKLLQLRQIFDCGLSIAVAAIVLLIVKRWPVLVSRGEEHFAAVSRHNILNILVSAAVPLVFRACLLFWVPAPVPSVHDEFSHLLLADTIASGRLANPPHPFSEHFETIYVLQSPTYASIYPPGQGIVLGLAQRLTGDPWLGVWLSIACMGAAICWALSMWTSGGWSLLGGILAGLAYGVSTYWMNSYWGGAVSATGGALIFGAIGGLRRSLRPSYSFILALGLILGAFSRPYESFCAGLALLVVIFKLRQNGRWHFAACLRRFLLPAGVVILAGVSFNAVYNYRVTGSALELPYHLYQTLHGVPQGFVGQPIVSAGPFRFKDIQDDYLWQRRKRLEMCSLPSFTLRTGFKLLVMWTFFINRWFAVPIVTLFFYPLGRTKWAIIAVCAYAFCTSALYTYLLPHYLALYTVIFVYLAVEGLRRVRKYCWHGIPVGVLVFAFTCSSALLASLDSVGPYAIPISPRGERDRIAAALAAQGSRHLVFVTYDANHSFYDEWIYNRADIDRSSIVWARDLTAAENEGLVRYYPDRKVWRVEGREENARICPFRDPDSVP